MARRDPVAISVRLLTRNGHDWASRYPLIVEAVQALKVRSCLIDGEAVACDENGLKGLNNPKGGSSANARSPTSDRRLRQVAAGLRQTQAIA
jgi:hypothetical protein